MKYYDAVENHLYDVHASFLSQNTSFFTLIMNCFKKAEYDDIVLKYGLIIN
jgi:hypothetical protein